MPSLNASSVAAPGSQAAAAAGTAPRRSSPAAAAAADGAPSPSPPHEPRGPCILGLTGGIGMGERTPPTRNTHSQSPSPPTPTPYTPTPHTPYPQPPKGKSTVSDLFRTQAGAPVIDADAIVHQLYSAGGAAVGPVGAAFPTALVNGAIHRPSLSAAVVGDNAAMARLEGIVHPLVEAERVAALRAAAAAGARLVVLGEFEENGLVAWLVW
jgi:hypothetical protein